MLRDVKLSGENDADDSTLIWVCDVALPCRSGSLTERQSPNKNDVVALCLSEFCVFELVVTAATHINAIKLILSFK